LQRRRYHACAFNPEETPMDITIFHNPRCGTSRNTLALIREAGQGPRVVDYLATPPARAELAQMIAQAGLSVRAGGVAR
jgi:arsenate reductase